MVVNLLQNFALLLAMGLLYAMVASRMNLRSTRGEIVSGVLFGVITLGAMTSHVDVLPGVVFDGRSIALACAGAFGGPIAATIAATMAIGARIYLGGAGLITGVGVIVTSAVIGVAGYQWRRAQQRQPNLVELLAFGLIVHLVMQVWMLALPADVRPGAARAILPYTLGVYPIVTAIMGLLLIEVEEKETTANRLVRVNRAFRTLSESNRTISRATDESALIARICNLLVDVGRHDCVTVVLVGEDGVRRAGMAGSDAGYLAFLDRGEAEHDEPTALALRTGAGIHHQSGLDGPDHRLWMQNATRHGFPTILALPMRFEGVTLGALTMYSTRPHAFDDEEIRLLEELVTDLALGVGTLRLRAAEAEARVARRQMETLLTESEERYRQLVEMAPDGIAIHDDDGLLYINRAGLKLLGAERAEQVLGRPVQALMHPDWRARAETQLESVRRELGREVSHQDESLLMRLDGTTVPVEIAARAILYERRPAVQIIVRDISARRAAEEALRRHQELFQRVFTDIPAMLCIADASGHDVVVNEAFSETLGWPVGEGGLDALLGRCFPNPFHRGQVEEKLDEQPDEWHAIEVTAADGRRVESTWQSATLSDGTRLLIGLDHSDLRQAEAERDALQSQLYQSQKMEAVGRLAGGVAHDFNNLLTVINSYAELASSSLHAQDPLRADLDEVKRAGQRAAGLTRQLLAFSRKQLLRPKIVDPNALVEEMQRMLGRIIGEDITLHTAPAPDVGRVRVDPGQMEQVLLNLAVNSRDAMPGGGQLVITTSNVSPLDAAAELLPHQPLGYVLITVTDTGEGIDEAVLPRIFEPFFTTKEVHKGTGLGLSTVYGIVTQSGGDVRVHSAKGQGTTFSVYLPRCPDEATTAERAPAPTGGSETVLVVEDEEAVRALARRILERAGYSVLTASSGADAQSVLATAKAPIDLLLTDVVMPGMNGRELAQALRVARHDLRVLFMTGYTDDAILRSGTLDDDVRLITKPFSADDLVRAVRQALDAA